MKVSWMSEVCGVRFWYWQYYDLETNTMVQGVEESNEACHAAMDEAENEAAMR